MEKLLELLEAHSSYYSGDECSCMVESYNVENWDFNEHLAEMLKPLLVEVWYEGHTTYKDREMDDCRCGAWNEDACGCGKYGTGKIITTNPYEKETK